MFDRPMSTNKAGGFGVGKTGFLQVLAFRRLSKLYLKRYIIFIQLFINSKIEIYTIVTSGTIFFHYFVSESKYLPTHMICYDHVLLYFFFQKHN